MAITFPRDFPAGADFQSVEFKLMRATVQQATRSGAIMSMEQGAPLWRARFETVPLYRHQVAAWEAWWLTLGNGARAFRAYDARQTLPLAYETGLPGGFSGSGTLSAVSATTLTLSGLPQGFQPSAGDYVSVAPAAGSQRLFMIVETPAAAPVGGIRAVTVEPYVTGLAAGDAYTLVKPWCVMRPVPDSFSAPRSFTPEPVSFEAVQDLS